MQHDGLRGALEGGIRVCVATHDTRVVTRKRGWASAVVMSRGPGWPDSFASVGRQMQSYYCAEQLSLCLATQCYCSWRCRAHSESEGRDVCLFLHVSIMSSNKGSATGNRFLMSRCHGDRIYQQNIATYWNIKGALYRFCNKRERSFLVTHSYSILHLNFLSKTT